MSHSKLVLTSLNGVKSVDGEAFILAVKKTLQLFAEMFREKREQRDDEEVRKVTD